MIAFLLSAALQQQLPKSVDQDTRAWWRTTVMLSNDAMEGRDAGSRGYQRAADSVAHRLAAAGVKPLGENGTWFQNVPMEETAVTSARIQIDNDTLHFLEDIYTSPQSAPASLDAAIVYRGYCSADVLGDVRGKVVICHGTRRRDLPSDSDRRAALVKAGAVGVMIIADPGFVIEPPRWPFAYSRRVTLAGHAQTTAVAFPSFTLNAAALAKVIAGSGQDARALIDAGAAGQPLPTFDVGRRITASFTTAHRSLSSPNVVGFLPGTDSAVANEVIVLTAHLDGYGYGKAVHGDSIYNGTLDDAAYVALMIRLAERRHGKGFRRPLLFAAVTGEEKGLLGSAWLVAHLPVPKERIAANINLDQLRPIFPLELLTVHALDSTSLGEDARAVASEMGITVQNDPEPERGLIRRTDHWNFMQAGIPAINFVFGFRPGSESERVYREWYRTGYHTPQDDPKQHIDWRAAGDFNRFYYTLVERIANEQTKPHWTKTPR